MYDDETLRQPIAQWHCVRPLPSRSSRECLRAGERTARARARCHCYTAALRLGEAIRTVLGQTRVASALKLITMQDVQRIVDEAYRSPDAPIAFLDMREVAKLLRADVLVGLTPDSVRGQAAVVATLAAPIRGKQRVIGIWPRGETVELAKAIVKAIEPDSLFLRATAFDAPAP